MYFEIDGDIGVGKSAFLKKLIHNVYVITLSSSQTRIQEHKQFHINNHTVLLTVFDNASKHSIQYIVSQFCNNNKVLLLIYDISNKKSFDYLLQNNDIIKKTLAQCRNTDIYIIGNKIDLENEREVNQENVILFCKDNNYQHFESSVFTGKNISEIIYSIIMERINKELEKKTSLKIIISNQEQEKEDNSVIIIFFLIVLLFTFIKY